MSDEFDQAFERASKALSALRDAWRRGVQDTDEGRLALQEANEAHAALSKVWNERSS